MRHFSLLASVLLCQKVVFFWFNVGRIVDSISPCTSELSICFKMRSTIWDADGDDDDDAEVHGDEAAIVDAKLNVNWSDLHFK